jgi:cytochrome P450
MVSEELERLSRAADPTDESVIKNVAATMYAAGADTVVSALSSFFLVMSLYPDVQARAQKEIDEAIGHERRLPLFTDRPQLPFIVSYIPQSTITYLNMSCSGLYLLRGHPACVALNPKHTADVLSQLLRWNPVTPLGIAHYVTGWFPCSWRIVSYYVSEDDQYNGYRIPAVRLPLLSI